MVATLGHNGTVADPARDIETVEKAVYIGVIFLGNDSSSSKMVELCFFDVVVSSCKFLHTWFYKKTDISSCSQDSHSVYDIYRTTTP